MKMYFWIILAAILMIGNRKKIASYAVQCVKSRMPRRKR